MIHGPSAARTLARAARSAYAPSFDSIGNRQCLAEITRVGEAVIVAFQGTDDLGDWLSNADLSQHAMPFGHVHAGFWRSLDRHKTDIILAASVQDSEQLWVTGHSRGGAHALLFAAWCVWTNIPVAGVYTFGCPRVGDSTFAKWCDERLPGHHRYVYQSDIVARLPRLGYTHSGQLHWHDGSEWRVKMPWWTRLGAWLFARSWPFVGDEAADHGIDRYMGALAA